MPVPTWRSKGFGIYPTEGKNETPDIYFPEMPASMNLNCLVRALLRQLPKRRLIEFIGPMGLHRAIPHLQSFCVNSLSTRAEHWPVGILSHSHDLKHLRLGTESEAVRYYYNDKLEHVSTCDKTIDIVMKALTSNSLEQGATPRESKVETLELIGFDVTKFKQGNFSLFDWRTIISLSVESCWGLDQLFTILAPPTDSQGSLVKLDVPLRLFRLRVENSSHGFRNQLCDFLITLPGLSNLSVLLEYNNSPRRTSKFRKVLSTHGKTLKTLVWDERKGTQTSFPSLEGRFPCAEQILDITDLCKELVELGIPLDWQMFATSGSPIDARAKKRLRTMKHLRTLNIRTVPSLHSTKSMFPQWENMHSHFADTVIKTIFDTQDLSCRPPLDTLAIGALRYRDVRNGLGCRTVHEPAMYKYYRLQVYDIDRRYKHEGRYKPLAIPREVGTYEKTEAAGRCVEVLKPYWFG
ncbi:MAG: hypothetical protein Q9209_002874 [Squamulea sp. 1 TL-2023]